MWDAGPHFLSFGMKHGKVLKSGNRNHLVLKGGICFKKKQTMYFDDFNVIPPIGT